MTQYLAFSAGGLTFTASYNPIPDGAIAIDSAWLSANGPAPYYLDEAGAYYYLEADVTADKTAFAITNSDVTLDLHGHNISFGNKTQPTFNAGDFETEDDWDWAGSDWERETAPAYSGLEVWPYEGTHSAKITLPTTTADESLEATSTIALTAGDWIALSGHAKIHMLETTTEVYIRVSDGVNTHEAVVTRSDYHDGMQMFADVFQVVASGNYAVYIGVRNADIEDVDTLFVSHIAITTVGHHGIMVGPVDGFSGTDAAYIDGITSFGTAENFTLKNTGGNASIEQTGAGLECQPLWARDAGLTVEGQPANSDSITLRCYGRMCAPIKTFRGAGSLGSGSHSGDMSVSNCTLDAQFDSIFNRHRLQGVCYGPEKTGQFNNVKMLHSKQIGLSLDGRDRYETTVTNCTAQAFRGRYTNNFVISLRNATRAIITNNTVNCGEEEDDCRGMFIGVLADFGLVTGRSTIANNIITVRASEKNQMGGYQQGGSYCFQSERFYQFDVYDNVFTITGPQGTCFRLGSSVSEDMEAYNNTLICSASEQPTLQPEDYIACTKFRNQALSEINFHDNVLITNAGFIDIQNLNTGLLIMKDCTWRYIDDGYSTYAWRKDFQGAGTFEIRNPVYYDAATKTYMKNSCVGSSSVGTAIILITNDFVITFAANGVTAVALGVKIVDGSGATVYNSIDGDDNVTDANGQISVNLKDWGTENISGVLTDTDYRTCTVTTDYTSLHTFEAIETNRTSTIDVVLDNEN